MASELRDTFRSWSKHSEYVEDLVHLTHEGHRYLTLLPEMLGALGDEASQSSANFKADRARREMDDGFWMLHAHALMGLWGSLETLIEDIFVKRLVGNENLFASHDFKKFKLPISIVVESDPERIARAVLREVSKSADTGSAPGRFERVLKFVELDGKVPDKVSHALYRAQETRNICAHRAGIADERFVEMCPDAQIEIGQRVKLEFKDFSPLMHGLHMYAAILVNRWRLESGEALLQVGCRGYEGVMAEAFPSLVVLEEDA